MFKFCVEEKKRDDSLVYNDFDVNYLQGYKENEKIKPSDELIKIMSAMVLGSNK
tara:strand:+ start:3439 stop:3600 length:162 start_codon:yes stop_codon:yes gene_type:complete